MSKISETKFWTRTSSGRIELELEWGDANRASHIGHCDADVRTLSHVPYVRAQLDQIEPALLREELKEYGTWEEEELCEHEQNLQRILWLMAGDIIEEGAPA